MRAINGTFQVTLGHCCTMASPKALSPEDHLLMGMLSRLSLPSPPPLQHLVLEAQFENCCFKDKVIFFVKMHILPLGIEPLLPLISTGGVTEKGSGNMRARKSFPLISAREERSGNPLAVSNL